MKRWRLWFLIALFSLTPARSAQADAIDDLNALEDQIGALIHAKRLKEALALEQRYLHMYEQALPNERVNYANAVYVLGALYEANGDDLNSVKTLERAAAIREQALGQFDERVFPILVD